MIYNKFYCILYYINIVYYIGLLPLLYRVDSLRRLSDKETERDVEHR